MTYQSALINQDKYKNMMIMIDSVCKSLDTIEKMETFIESDRAFKQEYLSGITNQFDKVVVRGKNVEVTDQNKRDLDNCTFVIPFKKDFDERLTNLYCLVNYLSKTFNTTILIFEQGEECYFDTDQLKYKTNITHYYLCTNMPFSRTIVTNFIIDKAITKYLVINDVDCLTYPDAYTECMNLMDTEQIYLLHPFSTPPGSYEINDKSLFTTDYDPEKFSTAKNNIAGVGGIVFIHRETYASLGNENIYFISYSPEDAERVMRFRKLGYKCTESVSDKISGPNNKYLNYPLFHLSHPRTEYSTIAHKYYLMNEVLYHCLKTMDVASYKSYYNKYEG